MKAIVACFMLIFTAMASRAAALPADVLMPADAVAMPLWTGTPPSTPIGETPPEKVLAGGRVSDVETPRIWFFKAEGKGTGVAPAVLLIPGGGYSIVSCRYEGIEVARELSKRGIASAVLLYRCKSRKFPAPLLDARRALALLRQNAAAWQLDTKKIGVMGFSAGGHLAGLVSSGVALPGETQPASRPDFSVLLYPVVRLRGPVSHAGSGFALLSKDDLSTKADALALDALANGAWPRTYLLHEKDDRAVPSKGSALLADALKKKGVTCELHIVPGTDHGFGSNQPDGKGAIRGPAHWIDDVAIWLSRP